MSRANVYSGLGAQKTNHGRWAADAQFGGKFDAAARAITGTFKLTSAGKNVFKKNPNKTEEKGPVVPSGEEKPAQEQDTAKVEEIRRKPPNCSIFENA